MIALPTAVASSRTTHSAPLSGNTPALVEAAPDLPDWRALKDDPEETFFDECEVCHEKAYSYPRCQSCGTMDLGYLHSLQGRSA